MQGNYVITSSKPTAVSTLGAIPKHNSTEKCLITGLPVPQPSYEMGSVFPSDTNRTLACSARAQDMSTRRTGQQTLEGYIPRSSKRLKAICNPSSVEAYECKHTNVNAVHGKPTVKDGKSTFWKQYIS